ncbi:MAG: bifunctional proline dehydrogenase/L-glutamate gamma-semialdehyde dehydrogenase PutA [Endozoicomonadaceae bacterium]|nr:bifunctional proline dehydrogenase/L-glutamate gamma-semialdehyde dehydrogenase PutA [Endozoicomonadaceae bacterium]
MFNVQDIFIQQSYYFNQSPEKLFSLIRQTYDVDEKKYIQELIEVHEKLPNLAQNIQEINQKASQLIQDVRNKNQGLTLIDALMQQYSLNTEEGILLMCLAESLIRIPDIATIDALIKDCLSRTDWSKHLQKSDSFLVNAATWGLLISNKLLTSLTPHKSNGLLNQLTSRLSEPVIRKAITHAMKILGNHFVLGQTIETALENAKPYFEKNYTYSFDMLGEAAITASDAARYQAQYAHAIQKIGQYNQNKSISNPASISIKLSALHPRYEPSQSTRIIQELTNSLLDLIQIARLNHTHLTIDAEESDRLELSLKIFENCLKHPLCQGWNGLGLAVQAYSKRALAILLWIYTLGKTYNITIAVRLVKGAYWDTEIKKSQELGEKNYSVFRNKDYVDLHYLTCARFMLQPDINPYIFPQIASHNPVTLVSILAMSSPDSTFELQRLHGMGEILHQLLSDKEKKQLRIYAPVGYHKELLPYLVRRLLENGANSSFVNQISDLHIAPHVLAEHPIQKIDLTMEPAIPLPEALFIDRKNSTGINIAIDHHWQNIQEALCTFRKKEWVGRPMLHEQLDNHEHTSNSVYNPANITDVVGYCQWSYTHQIESALQAAHQGFMIWNQVDLTIRAKHINQLADLLEKNRNELIALCQREAGKTMQDAIDEIREAIDFCRYYTVQAFNLFSKPIQLPGPTGEKNTLYVQGRGVFLCISPWNFPLAIFLGQITAALITGNTVIAKPAEQTGLIATRAIELAWEAGIPSYALQLLPGSGEEIGQQILPDDRLSGVSFTGSTHTAKIINKILAKRSGTIIPFIAETGGQNAMIVDSTALPEQVIQDIIRSSFSSCGQRCSALRVLFIQEDVADHMIQSLTGAMQELVVGDPKNRETDIGPVIDQQALTALKQHIHNIKKISHILSQTPFSDQKTTGYFIQPTVIEIDHISRLKSEHFGPILHLIRFRKENIKQVITDINSTNFGLTFSIHSRNEAFIQDITQQIKAGNIYVNRNQIGAIVGVQPFGGMNLSGTGPKAGGPHTLYRYIHEKHYSINTTAIGGNISLMANQSFQSIHKKN